MKLEFRCCKCLKYKRIDLFSYNEKSKQGNRAVCTHCADKIEEADKKRVEKCIMHK